MSGVDVELCRFGSNPISGVRARCSLQFTRRKVHQPAVPQEFRLLQVQVIRRRIGQCHLPAAFHRWHPIQ